MLNLCLHRQIWMQKKKQWGRTDEDSEESYKSLVESKEVSEKGRRWEEESERSPSDVVNFYTLDL